MKIKSTYITMKSKVLLVLACTDQEKPHVGSIERFRPRGTCASFTGFWAHTTASVREDTNQINKVQT